MWFHGPAFCAGGFSGMPFFGIGLIFQLLIFAAIAYAVFYIVRGRSFCCTTNDNASNEALIKEIKELKEEIKNLKKDV